jgi:ferritin
MSTSQFAEQLNAQIGNEFAAHQQYVAIAVHYDTLTMPALAAYSTSRPSRSGTTR